ncbi:MAG: hypothetical protein JWQ45_3479 [Blastococcus sp.]|jgi:hypothetical protein|nr:hypothetical protein [Blastococcus sp.]
MSRRKLTSNRAIVSAGRQSIGIRPSVDASVTIRSAHECCRRTGRGGHLSARPDAIG